MINLRTHLIMEANQKRPSGLGKIKDKSVEQDVEMIAGDIYDLSDSNRYTEKMKYYKGEGNGYITDKEGHVYDVFTRTEQGDAGRIAGGSTYRYVTIKNVKGVDIKFRGYSAVFSSSHGMDIIDDIKAGMYLEDYLAKHWGDISNDDAKKNNEIVKLKETGNAEAKTYNKQKEESAADKELRFWERYLIVRDIKITVKNGDIDIDTKDADEHYKRQLGREKYKKEGGWNEEELYKEYISALKDALKPAVSKIFGDTFGCSISDMNGLVFNIVAKSNNKVPMVRLGFDIKKKEFVELAYGKAKLRGNNEWVGITIEPAIGPTMTLIKDDANERMIEIFTNASKEYVKLNKKKKTEWVNANWEQIWQNGRGMYSWNSDKYTKGEAKRMAAEEFKKKLASHTWETSGKSITFMTEFISQFMTAPEKIEKATGEEVENSPAEAPKKERGKNTVMGKGSYEKQEVKMDAWHKGERKQNVTNCSDAKLKLNYQICKDKGYEKEAAQLKAEAEKRGIVLEKLREYIMSL